ncbi:MAG: DUF192 domain-containing protein [Patescibacteria group bacterium]|jgi:uncharacterized membrane protein (UPF0127 family)
MSEHHEGMPGVVRTSLWILGIFVALMIGLTVYSKIALPVIAQTVTIGGRSHTVLVANTPTARYQGLSGRTADKLGAEGMMFTFGNSEERTFEMRGMLFSLDFLWVQNGSIVRIDENIQAPQKNEKPAQISSKPASADTVFEFPAGFAARNGLRIGDRISGR